MVCALAASVPVFASDMQSMHMDMDGFYVGAYAGMNSTTVDAASVVEFGSDGMAYGGFFGYEMPFGDAFMGVEAELNMSSTDISITTVNAEQGISYGLSVLGGIPMGDRADIYARVGLVATEFELTENDVTLDENEMGYVFGVGSRFALEPNLHLRMDYRYTYYNDISAMSVKSQSFTIGFQHLF